jgi:type IV secretory pathway VirB9-like protein
MPWHVQVRKIVSAILAGASRLAKLTGLTWGAEAAYRRTEEIMADPAPSNTTLSPVVLAVEKMNFGYKITGANEHIRPLRVFDDGAKTHIQMSAEVQHREAPVLVVLGSDRKGEMTITASRSRCIS